MELTEEIKDTIVSYALDELLHRLRDADFENIRSLSSYLESLSEDQIEELIIMTYQQF